jgi:hypothetical protein
MGVVVESCIESVTVYQQGATVSRRVAVECPGGEAPTEVTVAGLPLALIDGTVRVRVDASAGDFVATHLRVGLHVARSDSPPAAPDKAEHDRLRQAMTLNHDARDQLETELALLCAVPVPERPDAEEGKMPPASPMAARVQLEEVTDAAVAERTRRVRELRAEHDRLRDEIHALEQRMALASSARAVRPDELRKAVTVRLVSVAAAAPTCPSPLPLILEYHVPGARWTPSYQCRMSRDCREAEIAMRALVCQRSGEDWRGVALCLSTAAPLRWTELPELASLRIGRAQPPPPARAGFRPPPVGAMSLFLDHDRDRALATALLPSLAEYSPPALALPAAPRLERRYAPADTARALQLDTFAVEPEGAAADKTARYRAPTTARPQAVAVAAPPPPAPPPAMAMPAAPAFGPPPGYMPQEGPPVMQAPAMPVPPRRQRARAEMARDGERSKDVSAPAERGAGRVDYTTLRLAPAADAARRSRLQATDAREGYGETLTQLGVTVPFDPAAAVDDAAIRAAQVATQPLPAGTVDVRGAAGAFDYAYRADVVVDVPSDGQFHSVPVSTRTAASDVLYVVVPREDTAVYRQAKVHNPLAAPLLPGPVEVYVAGDYVLGSSLPLVAPKGELELGLGVEQAIKCARNTRYREERSGTKVVAMSELWHEIGIELANQLGRTVDVEVRERIPQPAPEAEVVVEEGTVEPPWEPYTQTERVARRLEGGRRWRLSIGAGERAKLRADYVVKIYAMNEIAGGNRREA